MSAISDTFTLGVTYWPRQAGYRGWQAFDRGAVRDELAHIAALGCDSVRLCLRWEDVQPGPQRINSATFRIFEQMLDLAGGAGLRAVAALFPVALNGALQMPRWVSHPDPLSEIQNVVRFGMPLVVSGGNAAPLVYDQRYHQNDAPDMFRDPLVHDAERYLIHEVVGYFGSHAALWGWQIGEGLELVRRPDSAAAVQEWYRRMADAVRVERYSTRVLGVTTMRGLVTSAGPRPEDLATTCDLAAIGLDQLLPLPGAQPLDVRGAVFIHALASALAERPLAVTGLGQPTVAEGSLGWQADSAYGRPTYTYFAYPEEQAEFIGEALERLHAAGAPAIWLADYADYPADQWRRPPLDRQARGRTLGLVDASGREKPSAETVRRFAAARRATPDALPETDGQREEPGAEHQERAIPISKPWSPALEVDPERYWRDPRQECERLWREFSFEK